MSTPTYRPTDGNEPDPIKVRLADRHRAQRLRFEQQQVGLAQARWQLRHVRLHAAAVGALWGVLVGELWLVRTAWAAATPLQLALMVAFFGYQLIQVLRYTVRGLLHTYRWSRRLARAVERMQTIEGQSRKEQA